MSSAIAGLTLRLLEERDLDALTHQFRFSQHHVENRWRERRNSRRTSLVAELRGAAAGSVSFEERPDAPTLLHLYALAVLPPLQNQGIGARLIEAVHDEAAQRALAGVYLSVNIENSGAIRLYERLGYGRAPGVYTNRWTWYGPDGEQREVVEDCYRMVKALGRPALAPDLVMRPIFGP